ncbi:hypothetical protein ERO13_D05G280766v2 [Gossypium hirsutum]|nr:hypothetical protein ERO13_D05G280766v2 [Gossypium hirsutum]
MFSFLLFLLPPYLCSFLSSIFFFFISFWFLPNYHFGLLISLLFLPFWIHTSIQIAQVFSDIRSYSQLYLKS